MKFSQSPNLLSVLVEFSTKASGRNTPTKSKIIIFFTYQVVKCREKSRIYNPTQRQSAESLIHPCRPLKLSTRLYRDTFIPHPKKKRKRKDTAFKNFAYEVVKSSGRPLDNVILTDWNWVGNGDWAEIYFILMKEIKKIKDFHIPGCQIVRRILD